MQIDTHDWTHAVLKWSGPRTLDGADWNETLDTKLSDCFEDCFALFPDGSVQVIGSYQVGHKKSHGCFELLNKLKDRPEEKERWYMDLCVLVWSVENQVLLLTRDCLDPLEWYDDEDSMDQVEKVMLLGHL